MPPQLLQYNNAITTQVDGPGDQPLNGASSSDIPLQKSGRSQSNSVSGVEVKAIVSTDLMDQILVTGLQSSQVRRHSVVVVVFSFILFIYMLFKKTREIKKKIQNILFNYLQIW